MPGTSSGGVKTKETNYEKYGKDFYKRIGAMGGKAKVPKGFAVMSKEKRVAAGRKGGSIGKRGKAKKA